MKLEEYGFKEEYLRKNAEGIPARIVTTYRDRYEFVADEKSGFAVLKRGSYYDNPNAIYPTIGDFVMLDYNESGDSRILETLKRISSFSRVDPSPDRSHEQLVAANFDYVFIMQSLNNNFNIHRLERYLTLSWQSGAIPVVILTKCDLIEDIQIYVNEVEKIAVGVDIYPISCKTKEGLINIEKYFMPGKTIVFLGSSGVGKSTLVNTLIR